MKKIVSIFLAICLCLSMAACAGEKENSLVLNPGEATAITAAANATWYDKLNFDDEKEFENATRGLIEAPESVVIYNENGDVVWSVDALGDISGEAPDTVNPSLWRNTKLNAYAGLFEVVPGIYQVRGYDMANVTFIKTDNGWIAFDVLMCVEDMIEAKALMEKHFGELDIKAVLYSHSHVDHFGGVEGLISKDQVADASLSLEDQLKSGKTLVLAPEGFLEHAVSENVYAGAAMSRRSQYQYGVIVPKGEKGSMAMGIGIGQSKGKTSFIAPTYELTEDDKVITIDGLKIEFQLTPGTEAPAEMNAYFPQYNGLWMAENCNGTMHNLYTLRGAQVRDASDWAKYIIEADQKFGNKTEVIFQSHNWPHWDEEVHDYLINTASAYKFIHDQTLNYINQGYTSAEIAHMIKLPDDLEKVWYTRQYYGTLAHNSKAVYQKYIGWYDANPVNLNILPPEESAKKLVEYLGDIDKTLEKAREDFKAGEYQWVAQITKELVYADPENTEARELCAAALEQLGFQAESGTWRNAYLSAARELREGNVAQEGHGAKSSGALIKEMTPNMIFDYIGLCTDNIAAQNDDVFINVDVTDTGEKYYLERKNGVLLVYPNENRDTANVKIICQSQTLAYSVVTGDSSVLQFEGDATEYEKLMKHFVIFGKDFNIIEP